MRNLGEKKKLVSLGSMRFDAIYRNGSILISRSALVQLAMAAELDGVEARLGLARPASGDGERDIRSSVSRFEELFVRRCKKY